MSRENANSSKLAPIATRVATESPEDEISLVIKGKIISVTDKEIIYKETGSTTEGRAPIHNLHFLRRANGEYRFFTPAKTELVQPTKIETESLPEKAAMPAKAVSKRELYITAGAIAHFARNADSADYVSGYSAFVARSANQTLNPKGFTSSLATDAAKMQFQFFAEPRLAYEKFMLGLSVGYAAFPKIVGNVSSPYYSNPLTVTMDGYFIPGLAMFYYRMAISESWGLNLGLGGGVMYSSIRFHQDDGSTQFSDRYTAWSGVATFKPELCYRFSGVQILFSVPVMFAETGKVESGSKALVNGDTGKVISPNLTGVGASLAIGYQLR